MIDQKEKTVLRPFVVAYQEMGTQANKVEQPKVRRAKQHLNKDQATRAVLNRIVERVKRI